MKKLFRLVTIVIMSLMFVGTLTAQVTTSEISGMVVDEKGERMSDVTVVATHLPSGTNYVTLTNKSGQFTFPSCRIGGPYEVKASFIGYITTVEEGFTIQLGEPYSIQFIMIDDAQMLSESVVEARRTSRGVTAKGGTSTIISSSQLSSLPTISRSISDFVRVTPQASNNNSFAGRDYRYNNISVDGANLNNSFGLSNDMLPGGGAQPITLESYDEISVNIAPFDVRQSGFTGAGVNAVTKSGTNTFTGSAYTYFRDNSFLGTRVGNENIRSTITDTKNNIYGGTVGGPIIKNKLFFFASGEYEKNTKPGITYHPKGGTGAGRESTTSKDSLRILSEHLKNKYGYETGSYDNFPNFVDENYKYMIKIDWNISDKHKLTAKYSDMKATSDVSANATSIPNGGGFRPSGATSNVSRLPNSRFGNYSMGFANSNYSFENIVRTATIELNSAFSSKISNQLLLAYSKTKSTRTQPGAVFPTIDIFNGAGTNQITAGSDPYTFNNDVKTDVYSITNNFSYRVNDHTFTFGGSYEYQEVGNMYMPGSASYYAYNTLDDFLNDRAPIYYANTFSLVPGQKAVYASELKLGQLSFYAQDEFRITPKFRLTYGLRVDKAIYTEDPLANPNINAIKFANDKGDSTYYDTGKWPESRWMFSPRVGFRWSLLDDNSLTIRGGAGIFTGRIPFVFLTNMPSNSYMYQSQVSVTNAAQLQNYKFNPDPYAYVGNFSQTPGVLPASNASLVLIDPHFKFPQIIRANLAVDKSLGGGFSVGLEALVTKDINAVKMRNANLNDANSYIIDGEDRTRPRVVGGNKLYSNLNNAIVLENTNKGYSYSLTAQVSKTTSTGLSASLAYTYTKSKSVTSNPGSQASSVWNANPNVGTSNDLELGNVQYVLPHRVVGTLTYSIEYAKYFASSISFFYQGSALGNYNYTVYGDLNGDGNSSADLMYIPRSAYEMQFEQYTASGKTFTPEQQAAAFERFIKSSPYLSKHRGEYVDRYAPLLPWYNRLDFRFLQDFHIKAGNYTHKLQFSVDILNVLNMVNKYWGIQQQTVTTSPLTFRSVDSDNRPIYRLYNVDGKLVDKAFQDNLSTGSTWSLQIGLKYMF